MVASAPAWDRFAHWPVLRARLGLLALVLLLVAAALTPIGEREDKVETKSFVENLAPGQSAKDGAERPRDDDLVLYDHAIARIRKGENYYDFIVAEHRRANYPVRPGFTVRLPTLAYIEAWIGEPGQIVAAIVLMFAVLLAWWRRLGEEPGGEQKRRLLTLAFLFLGVALGLNRYYFVLHELWSGTLLALAFGLHRVRADGTGRWGAALAVAALALAIREHALPFVLLMAAMAFWRRDWREGAAWSALVAAFLVALSVHHHVIAAQVLPSDPPSASWLGLRGLSGWLSNIVMSSNLRFLPGWLAGPAVVLMMAGWANWRSPAGAFGTLLFLGYGLAFMIAGRADNFYWGAEIAPAMFIGLAFASRAVKSLIVAAFPGLLDDDPSEASA
ncbi:hypothetical protein [Novosphingobium sp. JCM 18896]|uniref:hypothetical protein n=1 Tax=Novosphingobium sp. JCM 18896 TaxID=2989731 RepID=UPI0022216A9F|nr:hypothetical protein [Novosphingobium sp. JCM 18896]MCW1428770.1 hypothetical protein [Novosphingobium sp. JCM 18896]